MDYNDERITWNDFYLMAKNYYKKYGNLYIPYSYKTINGYEYNPNGYCLGKWISNQKEQYEDNINMSQKRIELLEEINIDWNIDNDFLLNRDFMSILNYCKQKNIDINGLNYYDIIDIISDKLNVTLRFNIRNIISKEEINEKENIYDIDNIIENDDIKKLLLERMKKLTEKEQYILAHRFCLNGEKKYTLNEIGNVLGCTTERIRQIEKQILKKLKHSPLKRKVMDYNNSKPVIKPKDIVKNITSHECDMLVDYLYADDSEKSKYLNSLCNFYLYIKKDDFIKVVNNQENIYRCERYLTLGLDINDMLNEDDYIIIFNRIMDKIDNYHSTNNYNHKEILGANGFKCKKR